MESFWVLWTFLVGSKRIEEDWDLGSMEYSIEVVVWSRGECESIITQE